MNSDRASAYGRVVKTIEELGPSKLLPGECARIRDAADALFFCEDPASDLSATLALTDVDALATSLVEAGRWTDARAARLREDVAGAGASARLLPAS